jgi:hypothetical protein
MNALRWVLFALLSGLLLPATGSSTEGSLFSVRLHANEFVEIGLTALTPEELTTVNQLVAARSSAAARRWNARRRDCTSWLRPARTG